MLKRSVVLTETTLNTIQRCAARHLVPMARLMRRVLDCAPWFDDDKEIIVLPIPKKVLSDPAKLETWLAEARQEILDHYANDQSSIA